MIFIVSNSTWLHSWCFSTCVCWLQNGSRRITTIVQGVRGDALRTRTRLRLTRILALASVDLIDPSFSSHQRRDNLQKKKEFDTGHLSLLQLPGYNIDLGSLACSVSSRSRASGHEHT